MTESPGAAGESHSVVDDVDRLISAYCVMKPRAITVGNPTRKAEDLNDEGDCLDFEELSRAGLPTKPRPPRFEARDPKRGARLAKRESIF